MDIKLLFNVIFAWASVVLAFLATVIWLLRVLIKKKIIPPRSFLSRAHRSLRISHIGIGIAFVITGVLHALFSSQALFSINYGTVVIVVALLLAAMYLVKKKVKRNNWLLVHRLLTAMLIVYLALHIYDIGGAPATRQLFAEISGQVKEPTESDQLLAMMDTENGAVYRDGVYTGVADGYGQDLTVAVTITDGKISNIEIVSHHEVGEEFYGRAMSCVPNEIIESQSVAVDSVSGATYTSVGIKNAVADVLSQASISGETVAAEALPLLEEPLAALAEDAMDDILGDSGDVTFNDGIYTGVADGFGPDLTVSVTIKDGLITGIEIVSHNEVGVQYYGRAMDSVPEAIIDSQSTEVDSVSGATYTSVGIKNAVADALSQAISSGVLPTDEALPEGGGGHGGGGGRRRGQQDDEGENE